MVPVADNLRELSALLERECVCVAGLSQRLAIALSDHGNAALVVHVEEGRQVLAAALRKPFARLPFGAPRTTLARTLVLFAESLAIYEHTTPKMFNNLASKHLRGDLAAKFQSEPE